METTSTVLDFEVTNKEGFKDALKKIIGRYKVESDVVWGTSHTHDVTTPQGISFKVVYHPVSVTLSMGGFKIQGYQYLGCIKDSDRIGLLTIHGNDITKDVDVVSFVESFNDIPCNKCNRKHSRKIGHLFLEEETNEIKIFGSGCSKKYFGIDFSRLLSVFERVSVGVEQWEESEYRCVIKNHVDFKFISKIIYDTIEHEGYISSTKVKEQGFGTSTSDSVKIDFVHWMEVNDVVKKRIRDCDVDFTTLINKVYNLSGEFGYNIDTIQRKIELNCLTMSDIGFVIWMIFDEFFKVNTTNKTNFVHGQWENGQKLNGQDVIYDGCHSFGGTYGLTYIYTFIKDDIRFKWFTGIDLQDKIGRKPEQGDKFTLNGNVKTLEDDKKYGKSIIVTRCNVK